MTCLATLVQNKFKRDVVHCVIHTSNISCKYAIANQLDCICCKKVWSFNEGMFLLFVAVHHDNPAPHILHYISIAILSIFIIEVIKQNFPVLKGLKVAFQANKLTRLTFFQSMIAYYSQRSQNTLLSQSSRVPWIVMTCVIRSILIIFFPYILTLFCTWKVFVHVEYNYCYNFDVAGCFRMASQFLRNKFSLSHAQSFRSLISISLMRIPSHTTQEKPPTFGRFDQTVIFHSSLYSCFWRSMLWG